MRNITRAGAALICTGFLLALAARAVASQSAMRVERGTAVVDVWRPDQHLYVKGDVGVSAELLDQLESWLDQNGTNWTIVLLDTAQGETFVDAGGERFAGMDAVEHALGKGLANRTTFGQSRDPRTGEPNGAWFALFLKERKFSYFGSAAQDKRGLGEDAWQGNLDRPAIAAMRQGGRIVDAVKDTIENINRRLTEKITAELRAHERRVAEQKARAERRQQELAEALAEAATALAAARSAAEQLRAEHPALPTPLEWLDLGAAETRLGNAHALRQRGDAEAAQAEAARAVRESETMVRAIEEFRQAPARMDQLAQRLNRLEDEKHAPQAKGPLSQAREALQAAQSAHATGDRVYREQLQRAQTATDAARRLIDQAARNARMARQLGLAMATGTGLSLFLLGLVLVLRRRGVKEQAEALVIDWNTTLRKQNSALIDLLERTTLAVGGSRPEAQKRWAGKTLDIAENVIRDVDALFIMAASSGRILEEAEGLVHPGGVRAIENLFRKRPYLAAIRRLRDEPIGFRPQEALEWVVRGDKGVWDKLLGEPAECEPFRMSFSELMAAFQDRQGRAQAGLDQIEAAGGRLPGLLETLARDLGAARALERELAQAAEPDAWFQAAPLFDQVFPAIEQDLEDATRRSLMDPVRALAEPAARAQRRLRDAQALLDVMRETRQAILPQLRKHRDALAAQGLPVEWIGEALNAASAQADQVAARIPETTLGTETAALADSLRTLLRDAGALVALDTRRRDIILPGLKQTLGDLDGARNALGAALKIDAAGVLREEGLEPDAFLAAADEQLLGLKTAAGRGDVTAAEAAAAEAERLNGQAAELISHTREAFERHAESIAQRRQESARLRGLCPEHDKLIAAIKGAYAPSTLILGSGDPEHPRANGTIQDNMQEARDMLAEGDAMLGRAETVFGQGGILEAADLLEQTGAIQELAGFRLREIAEKHQRLAETVASNKQRLEQLEKRLVKAGSSLSDPRTMHATRSQLERVQEQAAVLRGAVSAPATDPFADAEGLSKAEHLMEGVERRIQTDHELHAEAARSVAAAQSQLGEAGRWASQAASDRHPDSPAILQARRELDVLGAAIEAAAASLGTPHSDWAQVDAEADRIGTEAARCAGAIRGELQAAERAAAAIHTASENIRSTAGMLGALGLSIVARPGLHEFEQARAALLRGDYGGGQRWAESAIRIAQQELARARAEEARRRRAEEEARERRRRQRANLEWTTSRRRSGSFSGSMGGGFSSRSRGGFSMGSGSSRSGFSSRSGASRSGW